MLHRAKWDIPKRGQNRAVYINRHELSGPAQDSLHCHDFSEILFATDGEASHSVNGVAETFRAGELIFIRPNDNHQMTVEPGVKFAYFIVGFKPSSLTPLMKLYPQAAGSFWNLKPKRLSSVALTPYQQEWLRMEIKTLIMQAADESALFRFLVNLPHEVGRLRRGGFEQAPVWLQQAIDEARKTVHARKGPRVLAELSGRSFEHVSRILKKSCNLTPSQVVNRLRVEQAASRLVMSADTVLKVALDVGFQSLGQFYQEFHKVYGMTPRQYRLQNLTPFHKSG